MRLRILGPLQVWDGAEWQSLGAPKWRALLAALLVRPGVGVSVQQLIEDVWGNDPPRGAVNQIHGYVARVRRAIGDVDGQVLVSRSPGYTLRLPDDDLDARRFETLTADGLEAGRRGDAETAASLLAEALDLWRGPALADVPPTLVVRAEADRLEERRLVALEARVDADLELGRHSELVPELRAATGEHPLRERLWAHLMLALYRSGRQAEALDAYQRLYELLDREIGVEPARGVRTLHQRMLRADPELDLSAARPRPAPVRAPAVPRQLPAAVPHFAGREDQLKRLDELAASGGQSGTTAIAVVTGTAGVGKTTTVVYWAQQKAEEFPDGQLYVNLHGFDPSGTPTKPTEAIRRLLEALAVPLERVPPTLDAQVGLYRSLLADRRILLVLDNAHDAEQVRPLLPASPDCVVVVTSRRQLSGLVAAEGARPIVLDLLTEDESHDLLIAQVGVDRVARESDAIPQLIERCARLPLALTIAAAQAAIDPDLSLAGLAGQLDDARDRLDRLDAGEQATDVRAVLSWSYRGLSPDAARLFRLLGLHPGPDLSTAAAASLDGHDVPVVRRFLRELTRAHLVTEYAPGRFTFHDLLRAYAAELAATVDLETDRQAAIQRILDHYLHAAHAADRLLRRHQAFVLAEPSPGVVPPDIQDQAEALAWFAAERAVLVATTEFAVGSGHDTHAWQLATTLGEFLGRRGHPMDLAAVQGRALEAAQRLRNPAGQAHAHRGLARAQAFLGLYDAAETNFESALSRYGEVGDVIAQASTQLGLAGLAERRERYEESLEHSRQALDLFRSADHRSGQGKALNMIGWYESRLGGHRQALVSCRQALDLQREIDDRSAQADTLDSLGYVHHHLGDYGEAIRCYRDAIELQREFGDRRGEADTLTHLGAAQLDDDDPDSAGRSWRQALTILDDLDHPSADEVRVKLGQLPRVGSRG